MDRDNSNLVIDTMTAQGKRADKLEAISKMISRYNNSLSNWGGGFGGRRMRIVASITGGYFNKKTGEPVGGLGGNGWYTHRLDPAKHGGGTSGLAFFPDRKLFAGSCSLSTEGGRAKTFSK